MKIQVLLLGMLQVSYFYAISVERARYKETLFPGSLNLLLSSSVAGATDPLQLTDNSHRMLQYLNILVQWELIK